LPSTCRAVEIFFKAIFGGTVAGNDKFGLAAMLTILTNATANAEIQEKSRIHR
jgi:hypothetical protein